MKPIIAILAACLALAGCQTASGIDAAIQRNLPQACRSLETAHLAFVVLSMSGSVKQSTINKEAAAYAGVRLICTDPANVNAANALVLVAAAYSTIAIALKEAQQ